MTIFYVAMFHGETHDPLNYLLPRVSKSTMENLFAKASNDVFVSVKTDNGKDAGFVFVAPTSSSAPWTVFYTVNPMGQGELFGGKGPLTSEAEAKELAQHMSRSEGGTYAVFSFASGSSATPARKH